jgi:chromosome segregation ATPase
MSDSRDLQTVDRDYDRRNGGFSISEESFEVDRLKKEWYHLVLTSMEKMSREIDNIRRMDLENLKNDIKDRCDEKFSKIEASMDKLEKKLEECQKNSNHTIDKIVEKEECRIEKVKSDILSPLEDSVDSLKTNMAALMAKMSVWALLGGVVGTGVFQFLLWVVAEFLKKGGTP